MLNQKNPDFVFNVIIVGNSAVGKSCLLNAGANQPLDVSFISTVGVDFRVLTYEIDGKMVRLHLWDTAGQEKYKSICKSYYRGAHGGLFVYDITDRSSFDEIDNWVEDVRKVGSNNEKFILVGNKCDLVEQRKVDFDEGEDLAGLLEMKFIETSAKSRVNVDYVFRDLAKQMKDQREKDCLKRENNLVENNSHNQNQFKLHEKQENWSLGILSNYCCNIS